MTTPLLAALVLALAAKAQPAPDPPVQCLIGALSAPERARQHQLLEKMKTAVASRRDLANGMRLQVDSKKISLAEIGEWIGLESRCCPFLRFSVDVARGGAPLHVTLAGGEGVKALVAAEMGFEGSCSE